MQHAAFGILLLSIVVAGCASQAPAFVREPLPDNPALAQVRADIDAYVGRKVRWGGTVVRLDNQAQESWLEVVERVLNNDGRPAASDQSGGRFIAKVPGFLDPLIYTQGREITVAGSVDGASTGKIGEYDYRYPVIKADALHLWEPVAPTPLPYYDPFWYDPWYPYYPWWRRPYYY